MVHDTTIQPMDTKLPLLITIALATGACQSPEKLSSVDPVNWERRAVDHPLSDSLEVGETYLSVYSEIYSITEHRTHELTVTVSMRNTHRRDTLYVAKAEYFDTHGVSVRTYFDRPIFLGPLETVEIVIDGVDRQGGTGGNFLFNWQMKPGSHEPLFEAIMISTLGQQGLSFTTEGKRVE